MALLLVGLIVVSIVAIYLWFYYIPYRVLKNIGINGPPPSILYGNYKELSKMGQIQFYEYLEHKYGQLTGFYIGRKPFIMAADIEFIKAISVKYFDNFVDRVISGFAFETIGLPNGLLSVKGDEWRKSRRVISPTFSASKMKMMEPLIVKSAKVLAEVFQEKANSGKSLEAFKLFGDFTLETMLSAAFGRSVDVQKGESTEIVEAAAMAFSGARAGNIFNLEFLILMFSIIPCLKYPFQRFFKGSAIGQGYLLLKSSAEEIIQQRCKEDLTMKYKDLLQLMINATVEGCNGQQKLKDEEIISYSITFLLAGYETTANTLTYTSYLLALHPEIQQKLQEEIDDYFENNPMSSLYQASHDIKYLDMVINESLRLYPPAAVLGRECTKTYKYGNITIPKGLAVKIPVYNLHRNPRYWENPEEFNPLRFTPEEKAKRPQTCFLPFGIGPRSCVGMRFAMMEAKIALIELMKKISFVRSADTEVPLKTDLGLTLAPRNGVYIEIAHRNVQ